MTGKFRRRAERERGSATGRIGQWGGFPIAPPHTETCPWRDDTKAPPKPSCVDSQNKMPIHRSRLGNCLCSGGRVQSVCVSCFRHWQRLRFSPRPRRLLRSGVIRPSPWRAALPSWGGWRLLPALSFAPGHRAHAGTQSPIRRPSSPPPHNRRHSCLFAQHDERACRRYNRDNRHFRDSGSRGHRADPRDAEDACARIRTGWR